ncbi:MAG: hypothetical protein ACFNUQ_07945, partial [Rothia dentocariosa]
IGILLVQIATQFIKNIFEESVWRAYLTNQLLKLKLSDLKIYLLVGFICVSIRRDRARNSNTLG